jgi:two-component system, cell cycle response regulator
MVKNEFMNRILIAEDSATSRLFLKHTLSAWGYDVVMTHNGLEAMEELQKSDGPRLAILDWMMPEMDGIEVCQRIRQQAGHPYIYIIMLTAKSAIAELAMALQCGADDYVSKPFDKQELHARLRSGQRILQLQDALMFKATHDSVTETLNRRAVIEALEIEMARALRQHTPLAVAMLDLDHFKRVNDRFGHLAGDAVLRSVAERIEKSLRPYDVVGRYGGEEFLLVLPGCNLEQALEVAERLRQGLAADPVGFDKRQIKVTTSIGIAALTQEKVEESNELIKLADDALYRAKQSGRNCSQLMSHRPVPVPLNPQSSQRV